MVATDWLALQVFPLLLTNHIHAAAQKDVAEGLAVPALSLPVS